MYLVQLLPPHLRHLVGDQPALPDHDVCLRGVSLYADRAEDDTSEHGWSWGQVRTLTPRYLLLSTTSLSPPSQICDSFIADNILIKFQVLLLRQSHWWLAEWMRSGVLPGSRVSEETLAVCVIGCEAVETAPQSQYKHQYSPHLQHLLSPSPSSTMSALSPSYPARARKYEWSFTTSFVSSEKA